MPLGLDVAAAPPADAPPLEGVGLPLRALARLIDLGVTMLAVFVAGLVGLVVAGALASDAATFAALEMLTGETDGNAPGSRLWDSVLTLLAITAMHTLSEGLHGSTLGKRLCGITVVSEDGTPAGLRAAFKRSLGFLVDQLFFGLVGAHKILNAPRAQRFGDETAQTVVVRIHSLAPFARRSARRFLAATAAGILGAGLVAVIPGVLWLQNRARLAARDEVRIVAVQPKQGAPLLPGRAATFSVTVTHSLHSAVRGSLRFYVAHEGDVTLERTVPITARTGKTRLEATAQLPADRPGYSDAPLPRLIVELYPAANEASPSAQHELALERARCKAPDSPGQICIG